MNNHYSQQEEPLRKLPTNERTKSIISKAKITVVNIWTPKSETSKNLQFKLQKLSEELDDITFINLNADDLNVRNDFKDLLVRIKQVPVTIFVDRQGNIIGQAVVGDDVELIRLEVKYLLEINSPDYKNLQMIQNAIF